MRNLGEVEEDAAGAASGGSVARQLGERQAAGRDQAGATDHHHSTLTAATEAEVGGATVTEAGGAGFKAAAEAGVSETATIPTIPTGEDSEDPTWRCAQAPHPTSSRLDPRVLC